MAILSRIARAQHANGVAGPIQIAQEGLMEADATLERAERALIADVISIRERRANIKATLQQMSRVSGRAA